MEPLILPDPRIDLTAFVAATARVYGLVEIRARAVVMFGAVLRAELDRITIGEETNLQDNAVVHADLGIPTTIGKRATVGHAAVVHGATIGDHCLVGIGALALNGSELGEGAWLAAGSVLPEGRAIPRGPSPSVRRRSRFAIFAQKRSNAKTPASTCTCNSQKPTAACRRRGHKSSPPPRSGGGASTDR
jgi:carbonic anhydrase/acetyltransferase-like protein (isoleucine patch superfamily)